MSMDMNAERMRMLSKLKVLGVPNEVSIPFVNDVVKWCVSSGVEWSVSRLKAIKLDLIRKRAGLEPVSSWIRKKKGGEWFGGSVGGLERWGFRGNNFALMIQAINLYTSFISPEITDSQAEKFIAGVCADNIDLPLSTVKALRLGLVKSEIPRFKPRKPKPLLSHVPSPSKRGPSLWGSREEMETTIDSLAFLASDGGAHYGRYYLLYDEVLKGLEPEFLYSLQCHLVTLQVDKVANWDLVVGKIGIIQEPGYKLRAVANPGRVFQAVLRPLGDILFSILKTLPWDCTFDQTKADSKLLEALSQGKTVHSVDLTGATDYFPLELQMQVIRWVVDSPFHCSLFREVSKGWWMHDLPSTVSSQYESTGCCDRNLIRWSKGQPLGLYPSFASFALTHGLLLLGLLEGPWDGQFFVLGDDVVILDDDLYAAYRVALTELGCPVSESKTLSSSLLAEFTSRIYEGRLGRPIPQLKWRIPSDDSFLDILRLLGHKGLALLTPRQRRVGEVLAVLPDFMGGLGFNPRGLPLMDRMRPFLDLLDPDYRPVRRLTDYSRNAREILASSAFFSQVISKESFLGERVPIRSLEWLEDLDQRSFVMVQNSLGPTLAPWYRVLGTNLDKVLYGNIDLPSIGVPVRRSLLQVWEDTLGLRLRKPLGPSGT